MCLNVFFFFCNYENNMKLTGVFSVSIYNTTISKNINIYIFFYLKIVSYNMTM